jgi:UDP-glucose 4-epimerase
VTETSPFTAYEGCYALSKVIEETMLQQYQIQYGLDGCCLRAPWIMEKDDFRYAHTFGQDVFGGPRWCDEVEPDAAMRYADAGAVPVMLDAEGLPMRRNFVHVEDLVSAILAALDHPAARRQLFHIAMNEPVDYGKMGDYLARTRNLETVRMPSPFFSTWFDNAKARLMLGWTPQYDLERMIDSAWDYRRAPDDPRITWYPG